MKINGMQPHSVNLEGSTLIRKYQCYLKLKRTLYGSTLVKNVFGSILA